MDGTKPAIVIEVVAGLATLRFEPGWSTGRDDDTNPGIRFELIANSPPLQIFDGTYRSGSGVIGRFDAAKLRDVLNEFLAAHPVKRG